MASTESVDVDELEFCVWSSHVFTKSVWIFHGQFSKNSIKSPFLLSSQKPQASPCFPGNFLLTDDSSTSIIIFIIIKRINFFCFDLDHKDVAMFNFELVSKPSSDKNISYPTPSFFRLLPRVYHNMKQAPVVWTLVWTGLAKWAWSMLREKNPSCVSALNVACAKYADA